MTGRAAGFCAGYAMPGFSNAVGGWGRGLGRGGGGRGFRNRYFATGLTGWQRAAIGPVAPTADAQPGQLDALKAQADAMAEALDAIRNRIEELQAEE